MAEGPKAVEVEKRCKDCGWTGEMNETAAEARHREAEVNVDGERRGLQIGGITAKEAESCVQGIFTMDGGDEWDFLTDAGIFDDGGNSDEGQTSAEGTSELGYRKGDVKIWNGRRGEGGCEMM